MFTRRKKTSNNKCAKKTKKRTKIVTRILYSFSDKTRADMTCDVINGNLDYLANNNNVTSKASTKEHQKSNGIIVNGTPEVPKASDEEVTTRRSLVILSTIFITSLVAMFYIYKNFPELDE